MVLTYYHKHYVFKHDVFFVFAELINLNSLFNSSSTFESNWMENFQEIYSIIYSIISWQLFVVSVGHKARTSGHKVRTSAQLQCTRISLYLPIFPYISLYLPIFPYISLYLPISPCISLYLPIFPYISLYLPVSPYISLYSHTCMPCSNFDLKIRPSQLNS